MKNIIFVSFLLVLTIFTSCKKQEIVPGNYQANTPATPTSNSWQSQYNNGGTVPVDTTSYTNLIGTTWVLTEYRQIGFTTQYPMDTLRFIDKTHYTIQNGPQRTYTLTAGIASTNMTLTLNYFWPFGGSHYSAEVGGTFVSDGVMMSAVFKNIQNSTPNIIANFKKL